MNNLAAKLAAPALLILAALAVPGWAQDAASGSTAQSTSSSPAPTSAPMGRGHMRGEDVETRIKKLHDDIKITPAQEPQWDAFAQVMRDNAQKTHEAYQERSQKFSTMNADESMKSYAALAQMHAENMQKLATAFSALYGSLSNEQKADADAAFRYEHGRHHHHRGGMAAPAPGAN